MKPLLILILSLLFALTTFGQDYPDSGFTNKGEAKNLMVNGKKEGKWVEYHTYPGGQDSIHVYSLTIYKVGMPYGVVMEYTMEGKLYAIIPYVNGKRNGVIKIYHENGKVFIETEYVDDKMNGVRKMHSLNGMIYREQYFTNDKQNGKLTLYYENGKVMQEVIYINDSMISIKNYDENGNEIKE